MRGFPHTIATLEVETSRVTDELLFEDAARGCWGEARVTEADREELNELVTELGEAIAILRRCTYEAA